MTHFDEYHFDEWEFIEHFHPDYNCDMIAWIDDIDQILSGDYDPNGIAAQSEYTTWTNDELKNERNRMTAIVLREAMENYIRENLPHKLCEE